MKRFITPIGAYQSAQFDGQGTCMWSLLMYVTYSFIAPCNGLQRAVAQYAANQTRNTGANPFSFQ